jgi:hypothetical protein
MDGDTIMTAQMINYSDARKLMQPGDVIAFGGSSAFSQIIKLVTFSEVSHVGVILKLILQTQIQVCFLTKLLNQRVKMA